MATSRKTQSLNYQERIANTLRERAEPIAQAIAAQLGPPSDAKSVDTKKMLELWNHRQLIDPQTGKEVNPSELLSSGMPIEQIVDTVYPYRRKMVTFGRPDPNEQVKFAARMSKLADKYTADAEDLPESIEAVDETDDEDY